MIVRSLLSLACVLALTGASAAYEWNPVQKRMFAEDCNKSCRENAKVRASEKEGCVDYCNCVLNEGQERFSAKDYDEMDDDSRAGRQTPKLKEFAALFPVCTRKAFR